MLNEYLLQHDLHHKRLEKLLIYYEFTYGIHMIGREKLIPLNDNFIYITKYGKRE